MNLGENPGRRKSKVSYATVGDVGLGGPKLRAKAVSDGQLVSIPAPVSCRLKRRSDAGG